MSFKKELGQYFTKNKILTDKMIQLVKNNIDLILEPSFGMGHLINIFKERNFDAYEIDSSLENIIENKNVDIIYGNFLKKNINKKYHTIIGNPPYVKTKNSLNSYQLFIKKCVSLLEENGELIFIIPSNFITLTSSKEILNDMLKEGSFTDFFFFHNEHLFENASIDVCIFRFQLGIFSDIIDVNGDIKKCILTDGMITFGNKEDHQTTKLGDIFDIFVGLVSGRETIFKNSEIGNIDILTKKNKKERYILITKYPCDDKPINSYLLNNKQELINRKIRKFNEKNWFEWGALRNIKKMEEYKGRECLYVNCISRNKEICFISKCMYFGGSLLCLVPKIDIDLRVMCDKINSDKIKNSFLFSGRYKIGNEQLRKTYI